MIGRSPSLRHGALEAVPRRRHREGQTERDLLQAQGNLAAALDSYISLTADLRELFSHKNVFKYFDAARRSTQRGWK